MNAEVPGEDSPNQGGWICERPALQKQLWAIAARLNYDPVYWDRADLVQEGLVQIWRMEHERPGQKVSWYLQNAEFHLRDLLGAGRSLDSAKRHSGRLEPPVGPDAPDEVLDSALALKDKRDPTSQICADDIMQQLRFRLGPLERPVFDLLAAGFGIREVARLLHLSPWAVIKRRRTIAATLRKLGVNGGCE